MGDVEHFALLVLVVRAAITAAVLSNRISEQIRIPTPAIFLLAAAAAPDLMPALGQLSVTTVQRVVSLALVVILFDGGRDLRERRSAQRYRIRPMRMRPEVQVSRPTAGPEQRKRWLNTGEGSSWGASRAACARNSG